MEIFRIEGREKLIKYSFCFVNALLFVFGLVLLALGAFALMGGASEISKAINTSFYTTTATLFVVGGVMFVVTSYLGCHAALTSNKHMLSAFNVSVVVLFFVCFTVAITGYRMSQEKLNVMQHDMWATMRDYGRSRDTERAWNSMQLQFECCGVHDGHDYRGLLPPGKRAPASCCKTFDDEELLPCTEEPDTWNSNYKTGCAEKVHAFLADKGKLFGSISVCVLVLLVVGTLVSCVVRRSANYITLES